MGGWRFALARARAALPTLVALAVVAAISALLATAMAGAIRTVEAHEVRAAAAAASGDRAALRVSADAVAGDELAAAVAESLVRLGITHGLLVAADGSGVLVGIDPDRIAGDDVGVLDDRLDGLRDSLEQQLEGRVQVAGALGETISAVREGMDARRGPTTVAVAMLGVMTAVVVSAVSFDAVRMREGENRLLRARGARRRQLSGVAAGEVAVVALIGAVTGAAAGIAVSVLLGGISPGWLFGVVVSVAIATIAVLTAAVGTARGVDRPSARAQATAGVGAAVLLTVVTAVAVWQFWQHGTPVVERGGGAAALDPVVAIAPALILVLAALLAVVVATPIAGAITAALRGTRGVSPVTPLRLALRRPGRHVLSITVVAFAVGSVLVAAAYHGTITHLGDAPEAQRVGADVRVVSIPENVDPQDVADAGGADVSMLARPLTARGSQDRLQLLAAEAAQLGAVMLDAGGAIDPEAIGDALTLPSSGVPLQGDSLTLTLVAPVPAPVEFDGEEYAQEPSAAYGRVTVASAAGRLVSFEFENSEANVIEDETGTFIDVDVDPELTQTFALPAGESWSLAAIEVAANPFGYSMGGYLEVTGVESGGVPVELAAFRPAAGTPGTVEVVGGGLRFTPEIQDMDFPYSKAISGDLPAAVPAVVTAATAASMSLDLGDAFSLELSSPDGAADLTVVDIVAVLPGTATGEGVLVDLATLALSSTSDILPNQVWMSTNDPGATADAVHAEFPQMVVLVADPRAAASVQGTAAAFLLAAAGAVLLALVVLFLRRTRTRADSRELALLAVMGLGRRRAGAVRAREDVFAVVMGVVGGVAAGLATSWLIVPPLVRAAYGSVPDTFPIALHADPWIVASGIAAIALLCCAIVAAVRAPARLAPSVREDE